MTTFKSMLSLMLLQWVFQSTVAQSKKIVLEFATDKLAPESFQVYYFKTDQLDDDANMTRIAGVADHTNGVIRWELSTNIPVILSATSHFMWNNGSIPLEPGDSVRISQNGGGFSFAGRSADKFELSYRLSKVVTPEVAKMLARYIEVDSLGEFSRYFDISEQRLLAELSLIDKYRPKLTELTAQYLRGYYLNGFRHKVALKFQVASFARNRFKVPIAYFQPIYDTTLAKYWPSASDSTDLLSLSTRTATALKRYVTVKVNFDLLLAGVYNGDEEEMLYRMYYNEAKSRYQGLAQRKALAWIIRSFLEKGISPLANELAEDFLALPGYPQLHDYINNELTRRRRFETNEMAPAFSLTGLSGQNVSSVDFKGKIVIMDFWFTGCLGCEQMTPAMRRVEAAFRNAKDVVFLSISVDKDKNTWTKSVAAGKYTTGKGLNTYTGGLGSSHKIIEDYDVSSYPSLFILDTNGRFVKLDEDPRRDNGQTLIRLIKNMLPPVEVDGPYVFYNDKECIVKSVVVEGGKKMTKVATHPIKENKPFTIQVTNPYSGKGFSISLKKEIAIPSTIYKQPSKLLALSDIEGNLDAFANLLQNNNVMDKDYNWTFGDGHLVLVGDFFDRGHQVTEVLWLIYALEEKAKAAGGMVHFILGNHEIMNLQGNHKYVSKKYKNSTALLGKTLTELYDRNSELGRWLRSKNIVEKIGDLLFLHAGASGTLNNLPVSLDKINALARPHYDDTAKTFTDESVNTIMSTETGPFWYRGYYKDNIAPQSQIDSTLLMFDVKKIITGHTLISGGEKITAHYNDKVINVDTHHANGHSEALLIENGIYYRVNIKGKKLPLYNNSKTANTKIN